MERLRTQLVGWGVVVGAKGGISLIDQGERDEEWDECEWCYEELWRNVSLCVILMLRNLGCEVHTGVQEKEERNYIPVRQQIPSERLVQAATEAATIALETVARMTWC
jgi:hypothetical protein